MKAFRQGLILASLLIGPALFFGLMAFNRPEQLAQINKILDADGLDAGKESTSASPPAVFPVVPSPAPVSSPSPIQKKRPLWQRWRREFFNPLLAPFINLTAFNAIPRQSQIQWAAFQNRALRKESAAAPSSPTPSVKQQLEERLGQLRAPRPPQ